MQIVVLDLCWNGLIERRWFQLVAKKKEKPPVDTSGWDVVRPFQHYADVWKREDLDSLHMGAYKEMEAANQLWIDHITFDKTTNLVVVEYRSTVPHEWILEEMKKLIELVPPRFPEVEQVTML